MGLGKTYTGSEKLMQLGAKVNLVICQKSKIDDWIDHFVNNYELAEDMMVYDLTKWDKGDWAELKKDPAFEHDWHNKSMYLLVINYDLVWRRPKLLQLHDFTLMLDESSLIQHETSKRTKFIMKLQPKNVILLSGTPTGGKYERLLTQMNLLGWKISEKTFWNQYVDWEWNETDDGYWQKKVLGYKNEERLKRKMKQHGCQFLKTEEVFDLPEQIDNKIRIPSTPEYKKFQKNSYLEAFGIEFVGDTILNKRLYERQLCGHYNEEKLKAFEDLLDSTEDRLIVFYNFNGELDQLRMITNELNRPHGAVNGQNKNLVPYEKYDNSVTFIQYQAGAMGLNLQKANKIIYFTPPLSSELFEQSKKRIHRISQTKTCFYYYLICKGSIEEKIYRTLAMRKDYTDVLFMED